MTIDDDTDDTPRVVGPAPLPLTQPWWLHARADDAGLPPHERDPLREFAGMATQIGLAAWMLGTAMTTACGPVDRLGAAPTAARDRRVTADAVATVGHRAESSLVAAAPIAARPR